MSPEANQHYWLRVDEVVGYDKGVGTRWVRVDKSSGTVHSHPVAPKDLPADVVKEAAKRGWKTD